MEFNRIYQAILENMSEQVYVRDLDKNLLYINPASERLTGWSMNKAIGKKCYEVFGDEGMTCRDVCPIEKAISKGVPLLHHEGKLKTRSGDVRDMQVSISPLYEAESVIGAVVVMEDITRLREVEQTNVKTVIALELEHSRLVGILESIPDGVYIVDQHFNIQYINPVIERDFGKIQGRKCYQYLHDRTESCPWCKNEEIFAGKSVIWEWYSSKNDTHYELFGSPFKNPDGSISKFEIFRDTTQRKRAEEALQESENQKAAILDGITTNLAFVNEDLEILWANKAAADSVNRSPDEMVGHKCHEFWADPNIPCDDCPTLKAFKTKRTEQAIIYTPDGRVWDEKGEPVFDEKGGLIGVLEIAHDITDKKKLEARLQQAQKMESIATLAGGVAHEFNNALMGVMGNIELLKMDLPEDEGRDKYFEAMKGSGHRMSRLTDQLLAYAQGGKYHPKDLKLDDFVIQTLPILQHDLSPSVRVETHFPKGISYIRADNAQMQVVLSSILANSNEAIEDEGLIRITSENRDLDEAFTKLHPGLKPGPYVCLTIEDDGKGMDEETRNGIFEPFFTTKFQGRGMGMAAAYGIVINHDGWISVDSELGKGTVVQIYLPAISAESKEQGAKPVKQPEVELATSEGTILMIEDEDVVIEVTQAMLEMLGYRVMVAKTGKDAIHITETFDGQIDLALLDIKLPDMEGGKVYPLIMKARPDLKVIVFSGYSIEGPARKILDAGAQDFIQKPFSLTTLSEKLKEVSEGK